MVTKTAIKTVVPEIEALSHSSALNQLYGEGWECCLVSKIGGKYSQVHELAYCKDYVQDVIWGFLNNKQSHIYGMDYHPNKFPLDMKKLRIMIRNKNKGDEQFAKECKAGYRVVRELEKVLKFKKTTSRLAQLSHNGVRTRVWLYEADPNWMISSVMVSLYLLTVRMGRFCKSDENPMDFIRGGFKKSKAFDSSDKTITSDIRYLSSGVDSGGLQHILDNGISVFCKSMKENYAFSSPGEAHGFGFDTFGRLFRGEYRGGIIGKWNIPSVKKATGG